MDINNSRLHLRIERNYAAIQGTFQASYCAIAGFTTVFLSFCGLTNSQIGFATSLTSIIIVILHILVSKYSDSNTIISLKHIINALQLVAVLGALVLYFIPLSIIQLIIIYSISVAIIGCVAALLNAQMMQFNNAGINVNFGWPRGFGSIGYATASCFLGIVIAKNSINTLLPLFAIFSLLSIICVQAMPNPNRYKSNNLKINKKEESNKITSYKEMLRSNKILVVFLMLIVLMGIGCSAGQIFLIRVIESAGGGSREFGICLFISAGAELPMMFASSFVLKKFEPVELLQFSFFCYATKFLVLSITHNILIIYATMLFGLFCFGIYGFASVIFVNEIVSKYEKVRAQALTSICFSGGIGGIIGNFISGYIIDYFGLKVLMNFSALLCLLGAIMMVICGKMYKNLYGKTVNA